MSLAKQYDNGTDDGVVLVKTIGSELCRLPINSVPSILSTSTAGTSGLANTPTNTLNSPLSVSLAAPQVTSSATSSGSLESVIWGPTVGLIITRNATTADAGVVIDGVPYALRGTKNRRFAAGSFGVTEYEAIYIIDSDLGNGPHNVSVSLVGQPTNGDGGTRNLGILGWVANALYYQDRTKSSITSTSPVAVPTTAAIIPTQTAQGIIRSIEFYNTAASAVRVTLTKNNVAYWSESIPATTGRFTKIFDPPIQAVSSVLAERWVADATGVVGRINEV